MFQHTATRRWLPSQLFKALTVKEVSTHSHPKVAAQDCYMARAMFEVSTHSHPKVAAEKVIPHKVYTDVSTHSHPKVAAVCILIFISRL